MYPKVFVRLPTTALGQICERGFIAYAPGFDLWSKRWREEHFIAVGEIAAERGKSVLLLGGKDGDGALCERIATQNGCHRPTPEKHRCRR